LEVLEGEEDKHDEKRKESQLVLNSDEDEELKNSITHSPITNKIKIFFKESNTADCKNMHTNIPEDGTLWNEPVSK
jgi:hypothetical protein